MPERFEESMGCAAHVYQEPEELLPLTLREEAGLFVRHLNKRGFLAISLSLFWIFYTIGCLAHVTWASLPIPALACPPTLVLGYYISGWLSQIGR